MSISRYGLDKTKTGQRVLTSHGEPLITLNRAPGCTTLDTPESRQLLADNIVASLNIAHDRTERMLEPPAEPSVQESVLEAYLIEAEDSLRRWKNTAFALALVAVISTAFALVFGAAP